MALACPVFPLPVDAQERPAEVWVFTDAQHPVTQASTARVVLLDAPSRLEASLSAALPADAAMAAAMVQQRLKQRPDWQRQFASAYQGVTDAWSLGITRVPAIVVDRRYVVYGDTDVAHAAARIASYRSSHP
ncbi:MAG TPA: TIGR03757 family integrating conjugative element protein [Rhodanobacter sp.]|nr:TIGR03757 family integrating conjugative element protein [Rhodanobacter sp.]